MECGFLAHREKLQEILNDGFPTRFLLLPAKEQTLMSPADHASDPLCRHNPSMNVHSSPPFLADPVEVESVPRFGALDLLTWMGDAKLKILASVLFAAALSVVGALLMPNIYTARTTLLPPSANQPTAGATSLGALGSLGGIVGFPSVKTAEELYVSILRSASVVRPLVDRFDLRTKFKTESYDDSSRALAGVVRVSADRKSGVITVEVDDEDPKFAATLANSHVDELVKVLGRLAVSEAQQRRQFFANQLEAANAGLLKAEQGLKEVQQASGLIVLDKQAEALIASAAQLRGQIAEKEVQLKVLRTAATDQNPEAIRLLSELRGLRAELQRLESNSNRQGSRGPTDLAVRGIPDAASDYVRALREVKYQEAVFQSMLRQLEIARLDEAREGSTVQQIDIAVAPDRKSKPRRSVIVLITMLLAFLLSTTWILVRRYVHEVIQSDPQASLAMQHLLRAWRGRGA